MSTDWIKMRVDLRTHPKVVRMATALKADKLRVIGGLFAVWSIFDAHSTDGILEGYTLRSIDDELNWRGFAQAMTAIDWLSFDSASGDGLLAPRFEEHNGQSAKRRAMETERKRLEREAEKAASDAKKAATKRGHASASDADKSVTREEKRREEEIQSAPGSTAKVSETAARAPEASPPETSGHQPTPAGLACRAMKRAGLQAVNPGDPRLIALCEQGATQGEFEGIAAEAVAGGKGFAWVLTVLQKRRAEAADIALAPRAQDDPTAWAKSHAGCVQRAAELAIDGFDQARETYPAFKSRVIRAHNERLEEPA